MAKLLITNIGTLATPVGNTAHAGAQQGEITVLHNAYVVAEGGILTEIGEGTPPESAYAWAQVVDAGGKLVTPGLVDCHTHLVFGGWREHELAMKRQGVPYLEILAQGGGILSTVRATRAADEISLCTKASAILWEMARLGVTTCEIKSGYGLDLETELKQLRVIRDLQGSVPQDLVPTYLGAHALPEEFRHDRDSYVNFMIDSVLPAVAEENLAEFCDVFCETGVFTAEESERILRAAQELGLRSKIHADEIDAIGGSQLAGSLGAVSAEHLIACPDEGIEAMAESGTVAVLLPATSLYLGKPYARARDMIEAGVPVAAASDFNPGSCPSFNLQLVMNLACWGYHMTPEEVLTAVTLNAAAAIGRADTAGTLEEGKRADLVIWDTDNLDYLFYRFGQNLAKTVICKGAVI